MFEQAYAVLEIKSLDPATRTIEGIATTPTPDRRGDIIEPAGAEFTLPLPLLWNHNVNAPIGEVTHASVRPDGIHIKATIADVPDPGPLRDRLNEAWQSMKARLVRGLSIGWKPIDATPVKGWKDSGNPFERPPLHVRRWQWAELSAVTVPMNVAATILNIKSAAIGADLPRDWGPSSERTAMQQTYAEQIAAHETKRGTVLTAMNDIMQPKDGSTELVTLDADQTKTYNDLKGQLTSVDAHLARLREMEAFNAARAQPIVNPTSTPVLSVKANVPKGTAFVRYAMALVHSRGDSMKALEIAKRWKDSTPEVEWMVKAAVAPGDTVNPAWAGVLVQIRNAENEFLELLRPATILGKIPNLRTVPFNTQVPVQTGGGTYGWVGQAKPKPVGKLALTTAALQFSKAAGIIVITDELAKLSSPSAETVVRGDMIAGMAQFLDGQFIDPAVAEVPNVSPASVTNGAGTAASSNDPLADLAAIAAHFAAANISLAGLTLIMSETNALTAGMQRDANGNRVFPGLGPAGGTAEGINVIASNAAGTNVIGLQGSDILYADEGGVQIDVSREASVMMDSAPVEGTTPYVSLWQNNLVGLRAERMINWLRGRQAAVYYLTAAVYTPA